MFNQSEVLQYSALEQQQQLEFQQQPLSMSQHRRLNTEELIQQTREHYNASKYQQKIKQLQLSIELKDKELQSLTSRILSLKQESSMKISLLERQIIDVKKELGQFRVQKVKQRRVQSERYQKLIATLKKEQQQKMQLLQQRHNSQCQAIIAQHLEEISRLEKRYEQVMQLQKKEFSAFKNIQQDKTSNSNIYVVRLQEEKVLLMKLKRQAQKKTELYKESMEKLKQQYKREIFEKAQELSAKNGQIQGLKLQEKLLLEKLETTQNRQFSSQSHSRQTYEQLNHLCSKLSDQNQQIKAMLQEKNDQILKYYKQSAQKQLQKVPVVQVYECNHLSLIHQMQANLEFKEKEIASLKAIVEQWRSMIGFEKPLSQRITEITEKSLTVKNLNGSLTQSLKKCVKGSKMMKN